MKLQLSTMFLKPEITLYWVDLAHIFEQKFKTDKFKLNTNLRFFCRLFINLLYNTVD
jgi:hypothetical protein